MLFLYELLMKATTLYCFIIWSLTRAPSRKRLFRITELVAYESFDCIILRSFLFEVVVQLQFRAWFVLLTFVREPQFSSLGHQIQNNRSNSQNTESILIISGIHNRTNDVIWRHSDVVLSR